MNGPPSLRMPRAASTYIPLSIQQRRSISMLMRFMSLAVAVLLCGTMRAESSATDLKDGLAASPDASVLILLAEADLTVDDDSSRLRLFRWMGKDLAALGRNVFTPRFALYSAGAVGGTFALAWSDDELTEAMHGIYTGEVKNVLDVLDYLGGPKINLPVLALAGGSMVTNNIKFQDAAFTSLQTLVYAGLIGYALKGIFGRARPEWTDPYDPYAFFDRTGKNPFSHEGNSSYPSGHAIASFGIITPWVLYYPSPFTYALYVLPIGTSFSRLALDKHWATDLVVGAAIGISMGRWLTHRHRRDEVENGNRVSLSLVEDGRLFSLRLSLE